MSGICGWVGDADPAVLDAMLEAIGYRGDSVDKVIVPGAALGYRWWSGRPGKSPGIHRQGAPILEPRQAIFFNYHDPQVRLDQENITYYRYHPLVLNAAFLGNLSAEDQRILGFGNKTNFQPAFEQRARTPIGYKTVSATISAQLRIEYLTERINARLRRALRMSHKS